MIVNDPSTSLAFSVLRPRDGLPARTVDLPGLPRPARPERARRAFAARLTDAIAAFRILAR